MSNPRRINGREGVTRDTPIGGCHVTSRCPATPTVTHRDNVTSCHAVTYWRLWLKATNGTRVFSGGHRPGQPVGRSRAQDRRYCATRRRQGAAP